MHVRYLLAALLIVVPASSALAFNAGISRLTVAGDQPFDTLVWYATDAPEAPWRINAYPIPATRATSRDPSCAGDPARTENAARMSLS